MKQIIALFFALQLGIVGAQMETIDFTDIKSWKRTDDWRSKLVEPGTVKFTNASETEAALVYRRLKNLTLSENDFELSFAFQDLKTAKFTFVLGSNDLSDMTMFAFTPSGEVSVKNTQNNVTYFEGVIPNYQKKKIKNTVKMVKSLNILALYLNGKDAGTFNVGTLYSTTVFWLEAMGRVQVSDFIVTQKEKDLSKINLIENPNVFGERKKLGKGVNSSCGELNPIISPDDKNLYFVRDEDCKGSLGGQDTYVSTRNADGEFGKAWNIGRPINNEKHNSVSKALPDGSLLLLSPYDGGDDDVVAIARPNGINTYSFPENISIPNYKNNSEYKSVTLSASGKVMLFAIEMNNSLGGRDIYVSFKGSNGKWSPPAHCGNVLNSTAEENAPFLAPDDKTLYFSSPGHPGYGSNDIFVSRRLDDTWTKWSKPQNLGPKINTDGWDGYFTISASGEKAYIVTSAGGGNTDIYEVPIKVEKGEEKMVESVVIVKGNVLNSKTKDPIGADIHYFDLETNMEIGIAKSNPQNGAYQIVLPKGKNYSFYANEKGYFPTSSNIDLKDLEKFETLKKDLYLNPIEINQTITLNNIFFETGKADLKPESKQELNRLVQFMQENGAVKIKVSGHTDNVGSAESNRILSKNRAESVVEYLIQNGINNSRVQFEGYGETKPISTNETEEGKAMNRRVEFTIIE